MLRYERSVEMKRRRPWQRRLEVFSPPKLKRRLEGEAGRILDFWIHENRKETYWVIEPPRGASELPPKFVRGLPLRVLTRPDMIAVAMRIENWGQIVPYRISFVGQTERRLKPHRLAGLEAAFQPLDVSIVRAALFALFQ